MSASLAEKDAYIDSDGAALTVLSLEHNAVWYLNKNRERHRLDGPAFEHWDLDGKLKSRGWHQRDRPHRLTGPAVEKWDCEGVVTLQEFWFHGEKIRRTKSLKESVNPATDPKRLAAIATGWSPHLSAFAAHNPSCPEEAKAFWVLTHKVATPSA
jgi:hypothetical protein